MIFRLIIQGVCLLAGYSYVDGGKSNIFNGHDLLSSSSNGNVYGYDQVVGHGGLVSLVSYGQSGIAQSDDASVGYTVAVPAGAGHGIINKGIGQVVGVDSITAQEGAVGAGFGYGGQSSVFVVDQGSSARHDGLSSFGHSNVITSQYPIGQNAISAFYGLPSVSSNVGSSFNKEHTITFSSSIGGSSGDSYKSLNNGDAISTASEGQENFDTGYSGGEVVSNGGSVDKSFEIPVYGDSSESEENDDDSEETDTSDYDTSVSAGQDASASAEQVESGHSAEGIGRDIISDGGGYAGFVGDGHESAIPVGHRSAIGLNHDGTVAITSHTVSSGAEHEASIGTSFDGTVNDNTQSSGADFEHGASVSTEHAGLIATEYEGVATVGFSTPSSIGYSSDTYGIELSVTHGETSSGRSESSFATEPTIAVHDVTVGHAGSTGIGYAGSASGGYGNSEESGYGISEAVAHGGSADFGRGGVVSLSHGVSEGLRYATNNIENGGFVDSGNFITLDQSRSQGSRYSSASATVHRGTVGHGFSGVVTVTPEQYISTDHDGTVIKVQGGSVDSSYSRESAIAFSHGDSVNTGYNVGTEAVNHGVDTGHGSTVAASHERFINTGHDSPTTVSNGGFVNAGYGGAAAVSHGGFVNSGISSTAALSNGGSVEIGYGSSTALSHGGFVNTGHGGAAAVSHGEFLDTGSGDTTDISYGDSVKAGYGGSAAVSHGGPIVTGNADAGALGHGVSVDLNYYRGISDAHEDSVGFGKSNDIVNPGSYTGGGHGITLAPSQGKSFISGLEKGVSIEYTNSAGFVHNGGASASYAGSGGLGHGNVISIGHEKSSASTDEASRNAELINGGHSTSSGFGQVGSINAKHSSAGVRKSVATATVSFNLGAPIPKFRKSLGQRTFFKGSVNKEAIGDGHSGGKGVISTERHGSLGAGYEINTAYT